MSVPYATATPLRATGASSESPAWWRRIDSILVSTAIVLALIGLLMIYSATRTLNDDGDYTGMVLRQGMWLVAGLVAMTITAAIDYRKLTSAIVPIYCAAIVVLFLVLSPLGSSSKGAQAWFQVGGFQLQPSEFVKLVVITAMAAYCARHAANFHGRYVGVAVAIAAIPMALIMLQPDLGTVLVFSAIAFFLLLAAGASSKSLMLLVGAVVVCAVVVVQFGILKEYQLARLGAFLDPTSNTQQSAYNLNQSKIAIGSGELLGKGLFLGSQTNLRFVPEQHTDFIFTVVGEELGLAGSITLVGLLALLVSRVWKTARRANDAFGSFLCIGVLAMLTFQIFQNVGMATGIMPITGIPLPLVSYGGSSLLVSFVALGLVLSVHARSH